MIKDLVIWFLTLDGMRYMLFVPALAFGFAIGLVSMTRGLSRKWT